MRRTLKKFIYRCFPFYPRTIGKIFSQKPQPLWLDDHEFMAAFSQVRSEVLQDKARLYTLFCLARQASNLPGHVAEAGVYRGGTAKLIALALEERAPDKEIHLFDTFAGIPAGDSRSDPFVFEGELGDTSVETVRAFMGQRANCRIHQGLFRDTLGEVSDRVFCFVHVDPDIYEAVLQCCEFFYPRTVPGGMLLFDDYGYNVPGVRRAVNEFFEKRREAPVYLASGQCLVIKI